MKRVLLGVVTSIFCLFSLTIVAHSFSNADWEFVSVNKMGDNRGIHHYKYETKRAPYGPFDKIALHRIVKEPENWNMTPDRPSHDKKKVIFIIPGTWSVGYWEHYNPNDYLSLFLAIQGYDVYSMDFRTSYVPNYAYNRFASYGINISSTGDWTYGLFREDIKACVDETKRISRAQKVFLGGQSRGVTQMWIYAAKYLNDIKGLVGLDGGGMKSAPTSSTILLKNMTPTQISQARQAYEAAVQGFKNTQALLSEVQEFELGQFALNVPFAERVVGFETLADYVTDFRVRFPSALAPPGPIENLVDLTAYTSYWGWGQAKKTNVYAPYPGGQGETYMDPVTLTSRRGLYTRYWPVIQDKETSATFGGGALAKYDDCPFLDYDDNWKAINVPVIAFNSDYTCPGGCAANSSIVYTTNNIATDDVTLIHLSGFGHLDVYYGTHAGTDVNEPLLQWLNDHT